jgi:hypothetical protein
MKLNMVGFKCCAKTPLPVLKRGEKIRNGTRVFVIPGQRARYHFIGRYCRAHPRADTPQGYHAAPHLPCGANWTVHITTGHKRHTILLRSDKEATS